MKKTLFIYLILFSVFYSSQNIKAITDDGQEVVLLSDKTWKFVNESDERSLKLLKENDTLFVKDAKATFLAKSKIIKSGFYLDPKKWSLKPADQGILELQVINKNGNGFGFFGTEKSNVANYEVYRNVIIKNISKSADFFKIIESEIRTVNARKILFLRYTANIQGMDFEYAGYYCIAEDGISQLICYSSRKMFEEFYPGFKDLLNGFSKTEINKSNDLTGDIEYTSPPPPMQKIK